MYEIIQGDYDFNANFTCNVWPSDYMFLRGFHFIQELVFENRALFVTETKEVIIPLDLAANCVIFPCLGVILLIALVYKMTSQDSEASNLAVLLTEMIICIYLSKHI